MNGEKNGGNANNFNGFDRQTHVATLPLPVNLPPKNALAQRYNLLAKRLALLRSLARVF